MSAWLTSNVHRSALAQEICIRGLAPMHQIDVIYQHLTYDNFRSLAVRYGDEMPFMSADEVSTEDRTACEAPLDPGRIAKCAACWLYQCDEGDTLKLSRVSVLVELLIQSVEQQCEVKTYRDIPGVNDAPWGIDNWMDVVAIIVEEFPSNEQERANG